jgi:hypothetical protein
VTVITIYGFIPNHYEFMPGATASIFAGLDMTDIGPGRIHQGSGVEVAVMMCDEL